MPLVQAKSVFKFMDTPVGRLALKLPTGDMGLMGRTVAGLMAGRAPLAGDANSDAEVL